MHSTIEMAELNHMAVVSYNSVKVLLFACRKKSKYTKLTRSHSLASAS